MSNEKSILFSSLLQGTLSLSDFLNFECIGNINLKWKGKGILHYCINENNLSLFKEALAQSDIDVNQKDSEGGTPLRYTLRKNRHKMFGLLLENPKINLEADTYPDPLFEFIEQPIALDIGKRGNLKMVEVWIQNQKEKAWEAKGFLTIMDKEDWESESNKNIFSALDMAISTPNFQVLEYLLKNTILKPHFDILNKPIKNEYFFDATHLSHPGKILTDGLKSKEASCFWKALSQDKTQNSIDIALALNNFLEKKRLEAKIPQREKNNSKKTNSRI